jgi:hypothetical protein
MVELRVKKYPGLVDQGTFFKNINDQIILGLVTASATNCATTAAASATEGTTATTA